LQVELVLTGTQPGGKLSVRCTTLVVNAHGCGATALQEVEEGTPVTVTLTSPARITTARVLNCTRNGKHFVLGIGLDIAGNFWGLADPPFDWPTNPAYDTKVSTPGTDAGRLQFPVPRTVAPMAASTQAADNFRSAMEQARARVAALQRESTQGDDDMRALKQLREELQQQAEATAASIREETQRLQQLAASVAAQSQQVLGLREEAKSAANQLQQGLELLLTRSQDESVRVSDADLERQRQAIAELERRLTASGASMEARLQQRVETVAQELRQRIERSVSSQQEELEKNKADALAELQQLHSDIQDLIAVEAEKLNGIVKNLDASSVKEELSRRVSDAIVSIKSEVKQNQTEVLLHARGEIDRVMVELSNAESAKLRNLAAELAGGLKAEQQGHIERAVAGATDRLHASISARQNEAVEAARSEFNQAQSRMERQVEQFSETESAKLRAMTAELASGLRSEQQAQLAQAMTEAAEKFRASMSSDQQQLIQAAQAEMRQALRDDAAEQTEKLHAAVKELTSHARSELHANLERFAAETMTKLMSQVAVHQSEMLLETRKELQQSLSDLTARAEASLGLLRQSTEATQLESKRGESLLTSMREQQVKLQSWMERDAQEFQSNCQDLVARSTAVARARVSAAIDPLLESLERRAGSVHSELDSTLAEINNRAIALGKNTVAAHSELEQQARQSLEQQLEQSLASFRKESERAAEACILRWQNALAETLYSLPQLLRGKAQASSE